MTPKFMFRTVAARQSGLTLIELMVAVLLGLLLTAGALQVFISSKDSFRVTESNTQLMQSGRTGMDLMSRSIAMAGYYIFKEGSEGSAEDLYPVDATFPTKWQTITGTDTSVTVRYYGHPDGLITDCRGTSIADGFTATMTFSLGADGKLKCHVEGTSSTEDVTIAENVEQLQLRYGSAPKNSNNVKTYMTATQIGADWINVRAVQIGMLVKSGIRANASTNARSYSLFGTTYTSNDNYLREVFSTTAGLWNVMQ